MKAGNKKQKYDKISEKKMLVPIEVQSFAFASCLLQAHVCHGVAYDTQPQWGELLVYKDTSLVFKQLVCLNKCFK
jgi:casein kinase 1 epsilon